MADIVITCEQCGKQTSVSEFVSSEALVCSSCGHHLKKPETSGANRKPIVLKDIPSPDTAEQPEAVVEKPRWSSFQRPRGRRRKKRRRVSVEIMGWLIFVFLAVVLCAIRYVAMTPDQIETIKQIAPFVVFVGHFSIAAMAFKDDGVLAGVLCLLVPFYSMYYLFVVSDTFYLRAIVVALLLAFGYDAFLATNLVVNDLFEHFRFFIEHASESRSQYP